MPTKEVWAYGSRVRGGAHAGSDLDLVIRDPAQLTVPSHELSQLTAALKESDIPIFVEVRDWARLEESFRREIERGYLVLQPAAQAVARP